MSRARNKLMAAADHIQSLRIALVICLIVIAVLWIRNGHLQETRRLFIPPNLTQGAIVNFDEIPSPVIYTFASYIFQQLNRWKSNGEEDYPKQIYTLQGFLTPACIRFLNNDLNRRSQLGELRSRVRSIEELSTSGYSRQRVFIESESTWTVWLDFMIRETISGHSVKVVNVRYGLRVVRFNVDKEINPWGLAIDCDHDTQPVLIDSEALDKPFIRPSKAHE